MWYSKEYLKLCEKLKNSNLLPRFEAGKSIARGYADLGCEQFVMLTETKILSVVSGKLSDLTSDHQQYFFWIPNLNELTNLVLEYTSKIESISFLNESQWSVVVLDKSKKEVAFSDKSLEVALATVLLKLIDHTQSIS